MIHHLPIDRQSRGPLSLIFTGDVILDVPDPDHWLSGIAPALQQADLAVGHLEVPHTTHLQEYGDDIPAPGANPAHLAALGRAGFAAMTLAGNHITDCGETGIKDTLAGLAAQAIACCGAGTSLAQARQPALLQVKDRLLALLSYNCVGPESGWASAGHAGCAYLPVTTSDGAPVAPARTLLAPTPEALMILRDDIASARAQAALVVVALHKGVVHTPAHVAPYERALAHATIEAGADLVIGHHAHIVRGIEFHRGKPIFHGLGNGCVVTHALDPTQSHAARAAWAKRRQQLFGFVPDPAYTLAPFHPEAVNAFLARVLWHQDGRLEVGMLPVQVDPPGRPRLANAEEATRISAYVQAITSQAGLGERSFTPRDDMVVIT